MGAFLVRLLLVALVVLACCGCSRHEQVIELTQWTLVEPSGERRPVTLPARFTAHDTDGDGRVVLEVATKVPAAWDGDALSLAIANFPGAAALDMDGRRIPTRESALAKFWRLETAKRGDAVVALHLELDLRTTAAITIAPRLSPTEGGDRRSVSVAAFNVASAIAGTAMVLFVSTVYLALFLFDRRRTAHGWFALQGALASTVASFPLWEGLTRPRTLEVLGAATTFIMLAACAFTRAYFRWPRVPAPLRLGIVATAVAVALEVPAWSYSVALDASLTIFVLWTGIMVVLLVRESSLPEKRFAANSFAAAYASVGLLAAPDFQSWTFGGPAVAGGCIGTPTGLGLFAIIQAIVLGRDHIRSLQEAEERVKDLEAQRREVTQLNEELRHQVAERSRELTEALARSEGSVAPAALEVGEAFDGRYRVTKSLGRGGMGSVYEVERTRDGRKFALKVVTAAMEARQAARFAREAEIGARLQHENLVSIVDVGIAAGATPFLVMELVEGGSLEDRRARFGDAMWALPIIHQIASGLAALHANSVVHRDLKPGNVLLLESGGSSPVVAKISDFGISRFGVLDDGAEVDVEAATVSPDARPPRSRDLTQTGAIMGTPLYMPPEAWFGPARHPSADVFSFGVLAYEALTGRSPFAVPPVLLVRARQPIPTPAPLDGIEAAVASLILACMRVEGSERPRAKDLAAQLVHRRPSGIKR